MINKILTTYASQLEEYLSTFHRQPEGLATVGSIGNTSERPDKMVVCLLNVERENSSGMAGPIQRTADGYVYRKPPLLLNLKVMLAAVYDERRYGESLSVLSDTLRFIQSAPKFEVEGSIYTIEIVTLSTQDMNNVWTLLGGQYYPSVVCKIRQLIIDSESITASGTMVNRPISDM